MVTLAKQKDKDSKKGKKRMAKIGDRVTITIRGPTTVSGTASTATNTFPLGEGMSLSAVGKIIEDRGGDWLVELDSPLLGSKRMFIPKSSVG